MFQGKAGWEDGISASPCIYYYVVCGYDFCTDRESAVPGSFFIAM
jgi:hypothetical protein